MLDKPISAEAQASNEFDLLSPRDQEHVAKLVVGRAVANGRATLEFVALSLLKDEPQPASFPREHIKEAVRWCLEAMKSGRIVAVVYRSGRSWSGQVPLVQDGRYCRPVEYARPFSHSDGCGIFECKPCDCLAKLKTKKEKPPAWGELVTC
jgi:hypothetical protein